MSGLISVIDSKIKFNDKIKKGSQFLVVLALIAPVILHVTSLRGVGIYIYSLLAVVLTYFYLSFGLERKFFNYLIISFLTLFIFCSSISLIKADVNVLLLAINIYSSFIIALTLVLNQRVAKLSSELLVFFVFIWYIYSAITIGVLPNDANEYLHNLSRNHVSLLLIVFVVVYYSQRIFYKENVSSFYAFALAFCAIILYGRSGIFISFSVLFLVLIYIAYQSKVNFSAYIFCLFFLIGGLLILNFDYVFQVIEALDFSERGLESGRWKMLSDYIESLDAEALLLGQDLNTIDSIRAHEGNPHNSFIAAHANAGAAFLLFLGFIFFALFFSFIKKLYFEKFIIAIFFLLLIVRGWFDSIFFYGVFDPFLIYIALLVFISSRQSKKNKFFCKF